METSGLSSEESKDLKNFTNPKILQVELQTSLDDTPIESILKSEREPLYGLYQETKDERNELFNRAMEQAYKNPIEKYLTG